MSITSVPISLSEQLDRDENFMLKNSSEMVENVRALRQLASNPNWYNKYRGQAVVFHKGKMIARGTSSLQALNRGVNVAKTPNVYMTIIPSEYKNIEGDRTDEFDFYHE